MGAAIILNSLKLIFKWRFGCVGFYWSFTFLKMQICRVLTVHQNVLIGILLTKIFIQKCLAELDIYTDIDTDVSRIIASSGVAMQSLLINSGLGVFIYFGWKANGIITFWAFWLELSFEVILSSQLVQTVWKFFTTCSILPFPVYHQEKTITGNHIANNEHQFFSWFQLPIMEKHLLTLSNRLFSSKL